MSEYDVLINKYDALNAGYDQLYPKPMKHANTHASGGTDPITPSDIGAYSKNETDTLLANKAPAGYGLGENTYADIDWNTAVKSGFYSGTTNSPDGGKWFGYVVALDPEYCAQYVFKVYGYRLQQAMRLNRGNEWLPWEYINPLMELGVEYRTTERYMGKPVYAKLVDCGALPNGTIKIIAHGEPVLNAISCTLELTSTSGNHATAPEINSDNTVSVFAQLNQVNIIIMSNRDFSTYTAVSKIKYTKTTD